MMFNLTRRQKQCFDFIKRHIDENGLSPSFDEIQHALGLASKSGAHRLVHSLKERGWVDFLPHRRRTIVLKNGGKNE